MSARPEHSDAGRGHARLEKVWKETVGDRERIACSENHRRLPREAVDSVSPEVLRLRPALPCFDPERRHLGDLPAMVARVMDFKHNPTGQNYTTCIYRRVVDTPLGRQMKAR